jgi:MinD superfamily P-loop ATPase
MKLAVTGGKGGTGKSMVATSLAVEYARTTTTLLVDADVECPNDHLLLSVKLKKEKNIYQLIPRWNFKKCTKCGDCAIVCKRDAIVFVKGKYPVFVKDVCIGCGACIRACPKDAITEAKKQIGTVYQGKSRGIDLISGELRLGELASGEIVTAVRQYAEELNKKRQYEHIIIDSAAGVGCPVIASLVGTDYIVAVTEPTPSALHDLKRVLFLATHFQIRCGVIINKFDLEKKFCGNIERFLKRKKIPVIGKIPYRKDFVDATIQMKPVVEINIDYQQLFHQLSMTIQKKSQHTPR